MESIFLNNKLNANGIYGVNMYALGIPHTVIVDDYLPLRKKGTKYTTTVAGASVDGSLWGAILEKAFAKYHGNYHHSIGGNPAMSVRTLYGAPEKYIMHAATEADVIW